MTKTNSSKEEYPMMRCEGTIGPVRAYGEPPYGVALVHGGPGAPGEMEPVAHDLSAHGVAVIEPLQAAMTVAGQIEELHTQVASYVKTPICLVGYSWGALLALLTAAKYPERVNKVILVSSAVFAEEYTSSIRQTRLNRLSENERKELEQWFHFMNSPASKEGNLSWRRLHLLLSKADSFDPLEVTESQQKFQAEVYHRVWPEAVALRKNGELLAQIATYPGRVVAIHGDYDPHPSEGVRRPLSQVLRRFSFVELPRCGHIPWREKQAKELFYQTLLNELQKD